MSIRLPSGCIGSSDLAAMLLGNHQHSFMNVERLDQVTVIAALSSWFFTGIPSQEQNMCQACTRPLLGRTLLPGYFRLAESSNQRQLQVHFPQPSQSGPSRVIRDTRLCIVHQQWKTLSQQ